MMYEFFHTAVNTVAHHWFLSLLYVVLSARVVWRFRNQVVLQSHWSHRLRGCLVNRWQSPPRRITGEVVWAIFVLSLTLFLFLPFTPFLALVLHLRDEKRMREWRAKCEEQSHLAIKHKWRENEARARARKEWFAANPPVLFSNTVSGVMAIVRPIDYRATEEETKRRHRDGYWEREHILPPVYETFVFVNKQGRETIEASGVSRAVRYCIAGLFSDLDELVERYGVTLVHRDNLFVPWVNESVMPFVQQSQALHDCFGRNLYEELVMMQAPRELQPLP